MTMVVDGQPQPNLFTPIGGRRFFLTLLCQSLGFVALWAGKMTGGEYVAFTTIVAGAYIAGNVTQTVMTSHK